MPCDACHVRAMKSEQSHLAAVARNMTTSSAMNPALLLTLIISPISVITGGSLIAAGYEAGLYFLYLAALPVIITCLQLGYLTIAAPDRLQKEEHVEKMAALRQAITYKQDDRIVEAPVSTFNTHNPAYLGKVDE